MIIFLKVPSLKATCTIIQHLQPCHHCYQAKCRKSGCLEGLVKGVGWLMFGLKQWMDLKGLRRSLQRTAHTKYLYRVLLRVLDSTWAKLNHKSSSFFPLKVGENLQLGCLLQLADFKLCHLHSVQVQDSLPSVENGAQFSLEWIDRPVSWNVSWVM